MLLDIFSLRNSIKCIRCDAHIMWADRKFNPMFIFFKKALSILPIKLKPQPRGGGKESHILNPFSMLCKQLFVFRCSITLHDKQGVKSRHPLKCHKILGHGPCKRSKHLH